MKILVYRYGQLGDTVVALPSYWALREAFPKANMALMSELPGRHDHVTPAKLLPSTGLFDRHLTLEPVVGIRSAFKRLASLRRERFDLLVYLAPRLRTAPWRARRDLWFFRAAGIRPVIGHRGADQISRKVPGHPLPAIPSEAESLLSRLAAGGIRGPRRQGDWLALEPEEHAAAAEWLGRQGVRSADRRRCVAFGVGSKWPSKVWPRERFETLGRELLARQRVLPVVFGGKEDREPGNALVDSWGGGLVAAGELGVRQAAAAMVGMAGYVGNDTGTMHLAAAAGLPCVGIYAATDWPNKWYPLGTGHRILRTAPACEGCRLPVCPYENRCLNAISLTQVLEACEETFWWRESAAVQD